MTVADAFIYRDGVLHAEGVALPALAAAVGTPAYVYSRAMLEGQARAFTDAIAAVGPHAVAFAIKANPNLAVVRVLARCGMGADVVSAGEIDRAIAAGVAPARIVFSGVGKTAAEMRHAIAVGVGQFNIESVEEGRELSAVAVDAGARVAATLRVNPSVLANTHAKITTAAPDSKFGVPIAEARSLYAELAAAPGLAMRGVAMHIGSQISDLGQLETAIVSLGALIATLRADGFSITHADVGGGLGIAYHPSAVLPSIGDYAAMVARATRGWGVTLQFEPGRLIVGNAGVLLTEVIRVKSGAIRPFVIVDAAMNDLARPALYDAYHHFEPVRATDAVMTAAIVGPVCESGDTFAAERTFNAVASGDLAVFRSAGAYGATMASTYNSRPLVPEIMVDGDRHAVVADRIAASALIAAERVPDWL